MTWSFLLEGRKIKGKVYRALKIVFILPTSYVQNIFLSDNYLTCPVRDASKKTYAVASDRRQYFRFSFGAHARMEKLSQVLKLA